MTSVSVATNKNTIKVSEENASVVIIKTAGPQGPPSQPTDDGTY